MDCKFEENELLLRAVYPENRRPDFWNNGRLSSAALKDSKGLSVTRTGDKSVEDSVLWMIRNFQGFIVSISVSSCNSVQAYIKYCPTKRNAYHSEIHRSVSQIELSDTQAFLLAKEARIEYTPSCAFSV